MGKGVLADLVYARMNMHLLPHDQLRDVAGGLESCCFESLFEAACDLDEQQAVCEALAIRHALGRYIPVKILATLMMGMRWGILTRSWMCWT
jgi:hypothetical protein